MDDITTLREHYRHLNDAQFDMMLGLQREQRKRWSTIPKPKPAEGYVNTELIPVYNFVGNYTGTYNK